MFGFSDNRIKICGARQGCYSKMAVNPTGMATIQLNKFISFLSAKGKTRYRPAFCKAFDMLGKQNKFKQHKSKFIGKSNISCRIGGPVNDVYHRSIDNNYGTIILINLQNVVFCFVFMYLFHTI